MSDAWCFIAKHEKHHQDINGKKNKGNKTEHILGSDCKNMQFTPEKTWR